MLKRLIFVVLLITTHAFGNNYKQEVNDYMAEIPTNYLQNADFIILENYLNQIKTAKGLFIQEFNGERMQGKFAIKIPSALKMEYNEKSFPVIIIVTPLVLTYYDKELDQKSQVKTPKNASSLLLTSKLSMLDKKINITNFKSNSREIIIEFTHLELEGTKIKVFFSKLNGISLQKIELRSKVETIKTEFTKLDINTEIKQNEFQILNKKIDAKFNF